MPQYQGAGFYTGRQAGGDILREVLQGIARGRAQSMQSREQQQLEAERAQLQADRADERTYQRGRDAQADARVSAQDAEAAKNAELARALNLSQLRERGIMQGAAPANPTASVDLSGVGGFMASALPDPGRYTPLGSSFYEDRDATPRALAANQQRLIARIAQRVASGDASAFGDAVANGVNIGELDPTKRAGTPQALAAQRSELELKDTFSAREQARQVAGQLRVAEANRAADAAASTGKPPSEGELAGAGFLSRALEAHGQFDTVKMPNTVTRFTGDMAVIGQSNDFREWNAVRKNFATAVLRKESGASISPTEYEAVDAMYIPLPGDSDELKANKQKNREGALRTLQIMSGRANGLAFEGSAPILGDGQSMPAPKPRNPNR